MKTVSCLYLTFLTVSSLNYNFSCLHSICLSVLCVCVCVLCVLQRKLCIVTRTIYLCAQLRQWVHVHKFMRVGRWSWWVYNTKTDTECYETSGYYKIIYMYTIYLEYVNVYIYYFEAHKNKKNTKHYLATTRRL